LLPDRALDPYGLFNPREIWLLTIVIAAASFAGYIALKALGERTGLYIGAAAGALVSSTAVTLDLARRAHAREVDPVQAASAATLANLVMIVRVGALIAIFATPAFPAALPALVAAGGVALAAAAFGYFAPHETKAETTAKLSSPFDIKSVLSFAVLLAGVTAATRIITERFGDAGLLAFAATAGLMDVDAVSLAVGGMTRNGLDPHAAAEAILLAAAANTLTKLAIAGGIGRGRFALYYWGAGALSLIAGAAAFFLFDFG
ncbi:MAG: MgtC/SapB family protein, partial [Hyphomonadaceae bacterium]